jgi:hypothetical protein
MANPPADQEGLIARNRAMLEAALAVIEVAGRVGVRARLLGGLAIAAHLDDPSRFTHRPFQDIDFYVPSGEQRRFAPMLSDAGFVSEPRFNALNGHRRMLFHGPDYDVDVLVGEFEMCHRIDFRDRVELDAPTLPVADLLLTKLQIIELNAKDAADVELLVTHHEVARGHGDHIDLNRLIEVTSSDWGLWRTVTGTAQKVASAASPVVRGRLTEIWDALQASPKTLGWRTRARVGERVKWYQEPEEVGR